jgi:hypothetical protein
LVQLAVRLGCGATTILRRLRRFGIPVRPRGPSPRRETSGLVWSPGVSYAVGLIATDGNLSRDGRHLSVVSKDLDLLETLCRCLGLRVSISTCRSKRGGTAGRVQWSDRVFYDTLLAIGLTPAKSLTLGPLAIPDEYFSDFFRGCIDGDGSVLVYTDRYHAAKDERYVYQRLYVSLASASPSSTGYKRAFRGSQVSVESSRRIAKRSAERSGYCVTPNTSRSASSTGCTTPRRSRVSFANGPTRSPS